MYTALLWVVLIACSCHGAQAETQHMRVLERDIQTLTLRNDMMTAARRTQPVPQLDCVGGNGRHRAHEAVQVVQCYNRGWNGDAVQWECEAQLPHGFKLGKFDIQCEGYSRSGDEYVTQGSCGMEYELLYTAPPSPPVQRPAPVPPPVVHEPPRSYAPPKQAPAPPKTSWEDVLVHVLVFVLVLSFLMWVVRECARPRAYVVSESGVRGPPVVVSAPAPPVVVVQQPRPTSSFWGSGWDWAPSYSAPVQHHHHSTVHVHKSPERSYSSGWGSSSYASSHSEPSYSSSRTSSHSEPSYSSSSDSSSGETHTSTSYGSSKKSR